MMGFNQIMQAENGTSSIDKVAVLLMPLVPYLLQIDAPMLSSRLYQNEIVIVDDSSQSSGNIGPLQTDLSDYMSLYNFAIRYIAQLEDVPVEFDEYFKKNMWDLLA